MWCGAVLAQCYTAAVPSMLDMAAAPASAWRELVDRHKQPVCVPLRMLHRLRTWPYAKMHTLYPSTADWMRWRVSSNTESCPTAGLNTWSKLYSRGFFSSLQKWVTVRSSGRLRPNDWEEGGGREGGTGWGGEVSRRARECEGWVWDLRSA